MKNKLKVEVEIETSRLRIKVNGVIHLSFPYREDNHKLIVQSYFIGKDLFYNIDFHMEGIVIETGYTRKDLFLMILNELEKKNII